MDLKQQFNQAEKNKKVLLKKYTETLVGIAEKLEVGFTYKQYGLFGVKFRFDELQTNRNLYHLFVDLNCDDNLFSFNRYENENGYRLIINHELTVDKLTTIKDNIILNDSVTIDIVNKYDKIINTFIQVVELMKNELHHYFIVPYYLIHAEQRSYWLDYYCSVNYGFDRSTFEKHIKDNTFLNGYTPFFRNTFDNWHQEINLVKIDDCVIHVKKIVPKDYIPVYGQHNLVKKSESDASFNIKELFDINNKNRIDGYVFRFFQNTYFQLLNKSVRYSISYNEDEPTLKTETWFTQQLMNYIQYVCVNLYGKVEKVDTEKQQMLKCVSRGLRDSETIYPYFDNQTIETITYSQFVNLSKYSLPLIKQYLQFIQHNNPEVIENINNDYFSIDTVYNEKEQIGTYYYQLIKKLIK